MSNAARYLALFALCWIVITTWKLYPQFKDTLRVEGHVVSFEDYLADACGERVGPQAASCRATTIEKANQLLATEQAKSLLLIEAPLLLYFAVYVPLRLVRKSHEPRV